MKTWTVLILCGGQATRWKDHLETLKHFIDPADAGENLIERTVRLWREFQPDSEERRTKIIVVGTTQEYAIPGAMWEKPRHDYETHLEADKFASSQHLWNGESDGTTVLLYGDVWYSREAIRLMTSFQGDYQVFARSERGTYNLCPYGELFAHLFTHSRLQQHTEAVARLAREYHQFGVSEAAGWMLFRIMVGFDPWEHHPPWYPGTGMFTLIDDFTDDFDSAEDWTRWRRALKQHRRQCTLPSGCSVCT